MFGNRLGWGISGVIVLGFLGLMYLMYQMGEQSPPSAAYAPGSAALGPLAIKTDPETLLPMTDSCDAATHYADAIKQYLANPRLYATVTPKNVDQLTALEPLVAGTKCKDLSLFSKDFPSVVNFAAEHESVDALRQLGKACAAKANLLAATNRWDESKKYADAAFAMGIKLYKERLVFDELEAGISIMGDAAYVETRIAKDGSGPLKDATRVAALAQFDIDRQTFSKGLADLQRITHNIDGTTSGKRAGDVFAVAEYAKERMWRIEAMMQLGRMRYNVGENGRAGDQRYAMHLLRKYSDDAREKDAVVRHAATISRDLDTATYNLQTSRSGS